MRDIVRDLCTAGSQEIPKERWKSSSSIDEDSRPPLPFAVLVFGTTSPGMGRVRRRTVTVWIHDEPGDYTRIDRILEGVSGTLDGAEHVTNGDGTELMSASWQATSGDLVDGGFRTITRNATYTLIGTGE